MSHFDRLEVGSNAFELIEFSLDRFLPDGTVKTGLYGVNVAKVREVVRMPPINPLSSSIRGVAGVFELRGVPIPAINLAIALGDRTAPLRPDHQIIVTEFSMKRAGFIVKSTHRIRRVNWDKVLPPAADKLTCINGMTLVENNEFLFILDLEKIISVLELEIERRNAPNLPQFNAMMPISPAGVEGEGVSRIVADGTDYRILLVDDSSFILNSTKTFLEKHGFTVVTAGNGLIGRTVLEESLQKRGAGHIDLVVTDVEMPQMDGLTLTKWIKGHPELRRTPVVLHTSLSGKANEDAALSVGADSYVVKNDLDNLTSTLEDIVRRRVGA